MKQTPQEKALRERLHASRFSGEGFLGSDDRPVEEIVADDQRSLESRGISRQDLVAALRGIYEQARSALGREVRIRDHVVAEFHESMGRIPSPFRGDGVFEKGEAVVRDERSGERLRITSLGIAMAERHGFLQGRGSLYRIEPAEAVRLLGLESREGQAGHG